MADTGGSQPSYQVPGKTLLSALVEHTRRTVHTFPAVVGSETCVLLPASPDRLVP